MKYCPTHGLALVRATVTDSRGKSTDFLRCPFGFLPDRKMGERPLTRCTYARAIKLYSPEGNRIHAHKKPATSSVSHDGLQGNKTNPERN